MSEVEARILEILKSEGRLEFHDLTADESDALNVLVLRKWVERETRYRNNNAYYPYSVYSIANAGRIALMEYNDARDKEIQRRTDEEAEKERDRAYAEARDRRFNLLNSGVGAALGGLFAGIIDHIPRIVAFNKAFFHP